MPRNGWLRSTTAQRGRNGEAVTAVMVVFDPDSVSNIGSAYGWWRHDYQWSQGELIIMRKDDHNGAPMLFHLDGPLEPSDTTIT